MAKLLKRGTLKKIGKSFRGKTLGKGKSKKAVVPKEEPTELPVLASVASIVADVPAVVSFESQKEVAVVAEETPTPAVVHPDPPPMDSRHGMDPPTGRSGVVIDNVQDIVEKANDAAGETTNMSIASASKHSESNMSVSSAEVEVMEEAPKGEEAVVEEGTQTEEEVVTPEAEATDAGVDEKEAEKEVEADAADEESNLEPNIEIVQQDDKVAIGFYTPPAVVEDEGAEEYNVGAHVSDVAAHTLEQTLEFGAHTFEIGAQLMDQYFSCFPCQDNATPEQDATEEKDTMIETTASKKQMIHVIENTEESVAAEVDDRNENPAAGVNEEACQEIRV